MTTLAQLANLRKGQYKSGQIGIEVETECKQDYLIPAEMLGYWSYHNDGSLRWVGREFVFTEPYDFDSEPYKNALSIFGKMASSTPFIDSVYTSLHVHFNMYDEELINIINFIVLYFLFEEVLANYCGNDRNGNLFCLKTSNAEYSLAAAKGIVTAINEGFRYDAIRRLNFNGLKYGGLNIGSLRNLGSLEVRLHGGTTDIREIHQWVSILKCILDAARKFKEPPEIIREFRNSTPSKFLQSVFGSYSKHLDLTVFEDTLKNPLWYASYLANCIDNWSNFGESPKKEKAVKVRKEWKMVGLTPGNFEVTADENPMANAINQQIDHYTANMYQATTIDWDE